MKFILEISKEMYNSKIYYLMLYIEYEGFLVLDWKLCRYLWEWEEIFE